MTTYFINFADPLRNKFPASLSYGVREYAFSIPPGGFDGPGGSVSSSNLRLYGRGALEWGEAVDEDLLRITENFSGATPPPFAVGGQLWLQTKLYYNTAGVWYRINLDTSTPGNSVWQVLTQVPSPGTGVGLVSGGTVEGTGSNVPPTGPAIGSYWFTAGAGYQTVDVGANKTPASVTSLVGITTYTASVVVDGGAPQPISILGSTAATYATLINELNADTVGATWGLSGGDLICRSNSSGVASTVAITAGTLFAPPLAGFVAVNAATPGTSTPPGGTDAFSLPLKTNTLYRWDQPFKQMPAGWIERTRTSASTAPTTATNPQRNLMYWAEFEKNWASAPVSFVGPTAPVPGTTGGFWFNTTDGQPYVYDGTTWNQIVTVPFANSSTGYVKKAGDTMTGLLVLSGNPVAALGAATKQYVDNNFVELAGDTMTGALTLPALGPYPLAPTNTAATIAYVNAGVITAPVITAAPNNTTPTTITRKPGDIYVDTATPRIYISVTSGGTTNPAGNPADWKQIFPAQYS